MPRQLRIQYPGAFYHLMSRGDRKEPIYFSDHDRSEFLRILEQTCERTGWRIHSFVLMNNHYHLLVETPEANLVAGMHWLQTTYTVRFNLRHSLAGHLFQGRYKAIVIDNKNPSYFRSVSDYIHLNPVRAGLLPEPDARLESFRWSSYPMLIGKRVAPAWLETQRVLGMHRNSLRTFEHYMRNRTAVVLQKDEDLEEEWRGVRRGWFLGSEEFREELLDLVGTQRTGFKADSHSGDAIKAHNEKTANELLERGLRQLGVSIEDLRGWKTTDPRKQAIVWLLRSSTTVGSDWISEKIRVGHRSNISRAMSSFTASSRRPKSSQWMKKMQQCKD